MYIFLYSLANAEHKHVFWIIGKKILVYHLFPSVLFASWLLAVCTSFLCEIMYCITLFLHKNVCHVLCQFSVGEFHKLIVSVLYFKSFNKYLLKIKDRKYSYLPPKEGNRYGCGIHSDHLAQRGVIVLFDMKCKERPKIQWIISKTMSWKEQHHKQVKPIPLKII